MPSVSPEAPFFGLGCPGQRPLHRPGMHRDPETVTDGCGQIGRGQRRVIDQQPLGERNHHLGKLVRSAGSGPGRHSARNASTFGSTFFVAIKHLLNYMSVSIIMPTTISSVKNQTASSLLIFESTVDIIFRHPLPSGGI